MQIITKLREVYGFDLVSYETVRKWKMKDLTGIVSIKMQQNLANLWL